MAASTDPFVYQLRAILLGISPMIWRRLLVRSDTTIADLHYILQLAFNWSDCHLHQFRIHGKAYGISRAGCNSFQDDPDRVQLSDFQFRLNECFEYEYDFCDRWRHQLRVEAILSLEDEKTYPLCTAGKRAGAMEDCGGPWAFQVKRQDYTPGMIAIRLSEMLYEPLDRDLMYTEVKTMERWLSLERFDRKAINERLHQYAKGEEEWLFTE